MLQQVRYFLQVAECGSFSAAAKKLFLSPQALMKQTAALEGKLGGKLLERSSGGVRLTPLGGYALPLLEKLSGDWEKTMEQIRQYAGGGKQQVRVGIFSALPKQEIVTPFVTMLLGKFPDCNLSLEMLTSSEGKAKLESGRLELLLTHVHEEERWEGFRRLAFQQFDAQVCVSLYHPWVVKDAVTLEDLAGETFIKLQPDDANYTVPRGRGFYDTIPCREEVCVNNFDTMLTLLEQGRGFAVFPMYFTNMDRARCKAFPYPGRQLKFYMVLACRPKGQSETLDQIVEAAREEYGLYEL